MSDDNFNEAIELLCSACEIAKRRGKDTNWKAFEDSVLKALRPFNRNGITARTYKLPSQPNPYAV